MAYDLNAFAGRRASAMEPIYRINKSRKVWKERAVKRGIELKEAAREIRRLRGVIQTLREEKQEGDGLKKKR
jgi:hypothetical protein